jgi:hypothetical protein
VAAFVDRFGYAADDNTSGYIERLADEVARRRARVLPDEMTDAGTAKAVVTPLASAATTTTVKASSDQPPASQEQFISAADLADATKAAEMVKRAEMSVMERDRRIAEMEAKLKIVEDEKARAAESAKTEKAKEARMLLESYLDATKTIYTPDEVAQTRADHEARIAADPSGAMTTLRGMHTVAVKMSEQRAADHQARIASLVTGRAVETDDLRRVADELNARRAETDAYIRSLAASRTASTSFASRFPAESERSASTPGSFVSSSTAAPVSVKASATAAAAVANDATTTTTSDNVRARFDRVVQHGRRIASYEEMARGADVIAVPGSVKMSVDGRPTSEPRFEVHLTKRQRTDFGPDTFAPDWWKTWQEAATTRGQVRVPLKPTELNGSERKKGAAKAWIGI